jgi:hypothetical protein
VAVVCFAFSSVYAQNTLPSQYPANLLTPSTKQLLTYRTGKVRYRRLKQSSYTAIFCIQSTLFKLAEPRSRLVLLSSTVSGPLYTMNVSKSNNANVQLLACLVEPQDAIDPDYRFLVDGSYVKYVTTAPRTLAGEEIDWTFGPILLSKLLPPFPSGNWNKGYVAKDPEAGEAALIETKTEFLAGVESLSKPSPSYVRNITSTSFIPCATISLGGKI